MNSRENQVFNLLLISKDFLEKLQSKTRKEKEAFGLSLSLKNRLETSEFNSTFAELMLSDKEEFSRYLGINTASYQVSCV